MWLLPECLTINFWQRSPENRVVGKGFQQRLEARWCVFRRMKNQDNAGLTEVEAREKRHMEVRPAVWIGVERL